MSATILTRLRRSTPTERAEQNLPVALELVQAVRAGDPVQVQSVFDRADADALCLVLAGLLDDSRTTRSLLRAVARLMTALDGPRLVRPIRELRPCGTHAAFVRHTTRGEPIDPLCRDAERDYQRRRPRDRRVAS